MPCLAHRAASQLESSPLPSFNTLATCWWCGRSFYAQGGTGYWSLSRCPVHSMRSSLGGRAGCIAFGNR